MIRLFLERPSFRWYQPKTQLTNQTS